MRILLVEDYLPLQKSLAKGLREADFAVDANQNETFDFLWNLG
jgi:DNA-binding response OmpR family regulator